MKKHLSTLAFAAALLTLAIPASALTLKSSTVSSSFDTVPAGFENAEFIEFSEDFEAGVTNALSNTDENFGSYVYLKENNLGDYSVTFSVAEDGTYDFALCLMGWSKSVLRSTDVRIDDSEKVYLAYDYADEDLFREQYWTGISADLSAGEHTITLSLASDFDNSTVKSLYFHSFAFVKTSGASTPAAAEEKPADTTPAETTEEKPADTTPAAPQTADAAAAAVLLCGCAAVVLLLKKR